MRKSTESGNVLFLILIAVALFAALSYAVTSSSRGGSSDRSEKYYSTLAQYQQYASLVSDTLKRLNIINGCTVEQFSFESEYWKGNNQRANDDNPNAPEDGTCHVFAPEGGNLNMLILPNDDNLYTASSVGNNDSFFYFHETRIGSGAGVYGSDLADIVFHVGYLRDDFCRAINRQLHNENSIPEIRLHCCQASSQFDGTFFEHPNNTTHSTTNLNASTIPNSWHEGCAKSMSGNNENVYFNALFPR